ncbi:MAG: hypothetical protein ACJ77Z_09780, partial [Thermoleophilaceae bacterium]
MHAALRGAVVPLGAVVPRAAVAPPASVALAPPPHPAARAAMQAAHANAASARRLRLPFALAQLDPAD